MKQMLHPKQVRLWLSLVLAFLLTVLAIPFAAFAEGEGADTTAPEELLLRLDALDETCATYNPKNLTLVNSEPQGKHNTNSFIRGTDDKSNIMSNTVTTAAGQKLVKQWGGIALNTGLDLSADTPYTVEFYVKRTEAAIAGKVQFVIGFLKDGFQGDSNGYIFSKTESTAFILQNDGKYVGHITEWSPNSNYRQECKGIEDYWASGANEEGYTRFVMTYEKGTVKFYSGTDLLTSFPLGRGNIVNISTFAKLNLTAGFFNVSVYPQEKTTETLESGKEFADLKDISIYSGVHTPVELDIMEGRMKCVQFLKEDGTLLQMLPIVDGSVSVESFPEVDAGNKELYWIDQNTGKLLQDGPMTFTENTVIVAKLVGVNKTEIFGVQNSTPADGKVTARFVGGVYNLVGDNVGFDIVVHYKDGNGNLVDQKYRKEGSTVYLSILADGETIQANDKGVNYLFALVLEDIPAEGQIDFEIKAFKTVKGMRVYGEKVTASMLNGVFDENLSPLQ